MAERHISPIAIDLGAKHTGVFLAHYPSGTNPVEDVLVDYPIITRQS